MEMQFNGEFNVSIPQKDTFELLSDPQKFAPILPTFHSMSMKDDITAVVKVKVGIGRIHGIATTEMAIKESQAPTKASYIGTGKVMGGAYSMETSFELVEVSPTETKIKWQGTTQIVGKILTLAGGGMRGYAEKEITKVIDSLQSALSSKEHFEQVAQQAREHVEESIFEMLINFFKGLFDSDNAEKIAHPEPSVPTKVKITEPRRYKDPVIEVSRFDDKIAEHAEHNKPYVGQRLNRKEDGRLIRGRGKFVDDVRSSDMLHMGTVRSPYAHAKIVSVDASEALALPGVVTVLTGDDVAKECSAYMQIGPAPGNNVEDYGIAVGKTRYQGEPVALIVAESAREAEDAAELIDVTYEPLEPLVISEESQNAQDNLIHEGIGSNQTWAGTWDHGDVDKAFKDAAHVVKIDKLHFHRFSSTPLETAGAVCQWNNLSEVDIFCNNGFPPMLAQFVGMFLGVSTESVRTRTHDIGGNFGTKTVTHPYIGLAAFASKKVGGRQVKWVESRSENLVSVQGGERTFFDTEVALDANGVILGLRSRHLDDCGAFPRYEPLGCVIWSQVYPHVYGLRNIHIDFSQVVSNKTPCVPNRGYSRFQHMWFMERVIDICAHELGMAGDEIRQRNYIKPEQFPYETPNGCIYDSGNYPLMLEKAKELIDWDSWQAKKEAMTKEGRLVGIGIGTTLDSGTNNFGQSYIVNPDSVFSGNSEVARVKIDLDGSIVVMLGSAPQGQGHETVAAQTVADAFGLSPDFVKVRTGFDSQWNTYNGHSGTIASQFVVTGLSAVNGACKKLIKDMRKVASTVLQCDSRKLEFRVGDMGPELGVKEVPEQALNFWYLSNLVNSNIGQLPQELRSIDLNVKHIYHPPVEIPDIEKKFGNLTLTYSSQLHLTVVEVDRLTCQPKILDYVVVDDCGTQINPKIVGGQVHGATAHGIGAAIQETFKYDNAGNMLTSTFTDYSPITSMNMPDIRCAAIETKSPFTFNGAKGCGEGGGAPLHTISAAVQDALYTQGIIITESHNDPSTLLDLVNNPNRENAVSIETKTAIPATS